MDFARRNMARVKLMSHGDQARPNMKVFVSYSRTDMEFAVQLVEALKVLGFIPIYDSEGIHGSEDWKNRLAQMILEADAMVVVLTPASAASDICGWEVQHAASLNKLIIPIRADDLGDTPLPAGLPSLNHIFFHPDPRTKDAGWGSGVAKLHDALSVDIDWVREHTRLGEIARRWVTSGKTVDLLLRGQELAHYQTLRDSRPAGAPDLTDEQRDFLATSHQAQTDRESAERKRILEMQTANEERETALKAQQAAAQRVVQRTIVGASVAGVLTLAAGLFAYWAFQNGREAAAQQEIAAAERDRALAQEKIAAAERDKALKQEKIAQEQRDRAVAAVRKKEVAEKKVRRLGRYYTLLTTAADTAWGLQSKVDVTFEFIRDSSWLEGSTADFRADCPKVDLGLASSSFTPAVPPARQLTHCDIVRVRFANSASADVDVTALYLGGDQEITTMANVRVAAGQTSENLFRIVTWDPNKKAPSSTGRERLVVIAAEAKQGGQRSFSYVTGKKLAVTRGIGPKSGSLEDLLKQRLDDDVLRQTAPTDGGQAALEVAKGSVDDAVIKTFFWDVVRPCRVKGSCPPA